MDERIAARFRAAKMSPLQIVETALKILRKRLTEVTPGHWERPLDTRYRNFLGAALPEDETPHGHISGIIQPYHSHGYQSRHVGERERCTVVTVPIWSDGRFARGSFVRPPQVKKRSKSGPDLEYIALMDPRLGAALADWLEESLQTMRRVHSESLETQFSHALRMSRAMLRLDEERS